MCHILVDILIGSLDRHVIQGQSEYLPDFFFLNGDRGVTFSYSQTEGFKAIGLVKISQCFPARLTESVSAGEN